MKRVLIITYYWPPNGGAGVQRWLRISKYLPENDWQPVIYTPENPEIVQFDPELQKQVHPSVEVVKHPIKEPYSIYKRFTGRKKEDKVHTGFLSEKEKKGWKEDLALYIRSNYFIPDARVWWVKPSVRFLQGYLKKNPVDAIISTGPPHSMHLIALGLKRTLGLPWIVDMRDPWTDIDFYAQLNLSKRGDAKHRRLERQVLTEADHVVSVGWTMGEELKALGASELSVITNGFDDVDKSEGKVAGDDVFSLVHVGSASPTRNAPELWKALAAICNEDESFAAKFRLRLVGPVDHTVLESITDAGLSGYVERPGQLTHAEAIDRMVQARVLLLLLNDTVNAKGILTSKLFEYMATGRPILCIGDMDGDVARVIKEPHLMFDRAPLSDSDKERVKQLFENTYDPIPAPDEFSRRNSASRFAELLNDQSTS